MTAQHGMDRTPLIAFAGGGTGGHLYPALAIAGVLRERLPRARIVFFGTQRPIDDRILRDTDCELIPQALPRVSGAPWRWVQMLMSFRRAHLSCRARFAHDRPDIVVGTGGLGSFPAVYEAVRCGIPTALLNPDALPGRANRQLAKHVDAVFVQWAQVENHFPRGTSVRVLGCPVRRVFNRASRENGIERFDLDPARKTLLITGASQGARTINQAVIANLPFLERLEGWQVLHLTGDADFEQVQAAYRGSDVRAKVLPFTDSMADALGAADLVVSRAGASTLAEIAAVGRAAILLPYPYHKDMHQLANARCLVSAGDGMAARIVHDAIDPTINAPALREALEPLLMDDAKRDAMAAATRRIGRGHAATRIAEELLDLAGLSTSPHAAWQAETLEGSCRATR